MEPKTENVATSKSMKEFLENTPPNVELEVSDAVQYEWSSSSLNYTVATPELLLTCESESCKGPRLYGCESVIYLKPKETSFGYLVYVCQNCRRMVKRFSLAVFRKIESHGEKDRSGIVLKLGELPTFGPPLPARLISLIGGDRELFLKGRRAEINGLGIGAYAYYRRVVENEKGRIIREIGKVAERVGATPEDLELFKRAAQETQFSKAIDMIKPAIPESILMGGHNPLTLLHSATSEGLHEKNDATCLELAQDIRLLLTELADRISALLKSEQELKTAVSRLLARNNSK
jgi:hypothetical protein